MEAAMVAGGTVIAYWVDFGLSYVPSSVAWRVPIALQIVFAVALFAGISVCALFILSLELVRIY